MWMSNIHKLLPHIRHFIILDKSCILRLNWFIILIKGLCLEWGRDQLRRRRVACMRWFYLIPRHFSFILQIEREVCYSNLTGTSNNTGVPEVRRFSVLGKRPRAEAQMFYQEEPTHTLVLWIRHRGPSSLNTFSLCQSLTLSSFFTVTPLFLLLSHLPPTHITKSCMHPWRRPWQQPVMSFCAEKSWSYTRTYSIYNTIYGKDRTYNKSYMFTYTHPDTVPTLCVCVHHPFSETFTPPKDTSEAGAEAVSSSAQEAHGAG